MYYIIIFIFLVMGIYILDIANIHYLIYYNNNYYQHHILNNMDNLNNNYFNYHIFYIYYIINILHTHKLDKLYINFDSGQKM